MRGTGAVWGQSRGLGVILSSPDPHTHSIRDWARPAAAHRTPSGTNWHSWDGWVYPRSP